MKQSTFESKKSQPKRILQFGLIGGLAALVHVAAFSVLKYGLNIAPMIANVFAFLCAFLSSYYGQSRYTFADRHSGKSVIRQYFISASRGFILNEGILWLGLCFVLAPVPAVCIAIIVTAAFTYILIYFWVFHGNPTDSILGDLRR